MLYLRPLLREAIPKYVSGRTSYHRVWLAFHSYPQLIPSFFNISGFGPPVSITSPSPWPWIDRPVSGLLPATERPIQTRFPYASPKRLSSPLRSKSLTHYTKGTQSPPKGLPLLVRIRFQVLFHSPLRGSFRLSLTVLVHYRSAGSI